MNHTGYEKLKMLLGVGFSFLEMSELARHKGFSPRGVVDYLFDQHFIGMD